MARLPFWSDDFDMDLLKVIPDTEVILGETVDVTLFTHSDAPTFGRLNHPNCWNSDRGPVAFFGLHDSAKPEHFYTSAPLVECTFLEAVRDCWSHDYRMLVEGQLVLAGNRFWKHFQPLMGDLRGYAKIGTDTRELHLETVRLMLTEAARRLRAIVAVKERQAGTGQDRARQPEGAPENGVIVEGP